jgi:hypothetical protein
MGDLRTGKRYEIVFGPGIKLGATADAGAIDLAFEQVSDRDPDAVVLSAASDGLKVIGSEIAAAIEAGREACSIYCRVFDRGDNKEMSSTLELGRPQPAVPAWAPEIGVFDARSAGSSRKPGQFKARARGPAPRR